MAVNPFSAIFPLESVMSTPLVTGAIVAATIAAPVMTVLMVICATPAFAG